MKSSDNGNVGAVGGQRKHWLIAQFPGMTKQAEIFSCVSATGRLNCHDRMLQVLEIYFNINRCYFLHARTRQREFNYTSGNGKMSSG